MPQNQSLPATPAPTHKRTGQRRGGGLLTFIAQIQKAAFYFQRELKIQNPLGTFPLPAPPFQPVTDPQISPRQCKIPRNQTPRRELRGWGNTVSFYLKKTALFFLAKTWTHSKLGELKFLAPWGGRGREVSLGMAGADVG